MQELSLNDDDKKEKGQRRKKDVAETILQAAAGKKRGNHKPRWHVYPNVHFNVTEADLNKGKKFPSNRISTTKYNVFNFFPKMLFEQFRKVTNIFFLAVVIITFVPILSPVSPYTSFIPLAFIIAVSALREAYGTSIDTNLTTREITGNIRFYNQTARKNRPPARTSKWETSYT